MKWLLLKYKIIRWLGIHWLALLAYLSIWVTVFLSAITLHHLIRGLI